MNITAQILLGALAIGLVFGALANRTNFCVMGAVSDLVNFGHRGRLRAWLLAIGIATGGVAVLDALALIDMSLTADNETSNPPYRTPMFVWIRYLLGGLLFGVGMTLASGCGNKTMVRLGGGNLKSVLVLACIALGAYWMLFTDFFYLVFFQWMQPIAIDLTLFDVPGQDLGALGAALADADATSSWRLVIGVAIALVLLAWVYASAEFRGDRDNQVGGIAGGISVLAGWYLTAGPLGQEWLEEIEFLDERPFAAGAQSLTFISPTAHAVQYVAQGLAASYLTFGMAVAGGVIGGSFLYALVTRAFRLEWFRSWSDLINHVTGGLLMGIGGVLAMGCTIGQGMTGNSTLALGSVMATVSIVLGAALTMKYQYYRLLYEDAPRSAAMVSALADLKLLPPKLRKLEAL